MNLRRWEQLQALLFEPDRKDLLDALRNGTVDHRVREHIDFDRALSFLSAPTRRAAGFELSGTQAFERALREPQGGCALATRYARDVDIGIKERMALVERLCTLNVEQESFSTRRMWRKVCTCERSWWCPSMQLEALRDKLKQVCVGVHLQVADTNYACFALTFWESGVAPPTTYGEGTTLGLGLVFDALKPGVLWVEDSDWTPGWETTRVPDVPGALVTRVALYESTERTLVCQDCGYKERGRQWHPGGSCPRHYDPYGGCEGTLRVIPAKMCPLH